jgi:hypothetical protein
MLLIQIDRPGPKASSHQGGNIQAPGPTSESQGPARPWSSLAGLLHQQARTRALSTCRPSTSRRSLGCPAWRRFHNRNYQRRGLCAFRHRPLLPRTAGQATAHNKGRFFEARGRLGEQVMSSLILSPEPQIPSFEAASGATISVSPGSAFAPARKPAAPSSHCWCSSRLGGHKP